VQERASGRTRRRRRPAGRDMTPLIMGGGEPEEPPSRMEPAELAAIRALDDAYRRLADRSDHPDRCEGTVISHGDGYLECSSPACPGGPYAVLHDPGHVYPCVLRPDLVTTMVNHCPRCPAAIGATEAVTAFAGPAGETEPFHG
jgi:hypothetical protein